MKRSLFFFVFFGIALCLGAMTTAANAQATRTWVSGTGDDVNPCSRTAPCKTFAGAVSKTAAGGEIDAIDPGGFGTLTITKAITIDGGGGQVASVLASGTYGFQVSAGASDIVTLRNLRIVGTVQYSSPGITGIKWNTGGVLNVDSCVIQGFTSFGIDFEPASAGVLNVRNSIIQDATAGGLVASTTTGINRVNVERTEFFNNGGFGVKAGTLSRVQVSDSMIAGTGSGDGALVNAGGLGLERVTISGGAGNGVHATNTGTAWISNVTVTNNIGAGLVVDTGGVINSFLQNRIANNSGGPGPVPTTAVPGQE
ncbi:MAG: right-handed parallel beta-helix repeat-containing protein [Candidatus Eremiobacteraeota bacterium]|nr:right-handed parallel beta-helix repeat-containing protein [Candidatus Eremiobacteraeota bacterium]